MPTVQVKFDPFNEVLDFRTAKEVGRAEKKWVSVVCNCGMTCVRDVASDPSFPCPYCKRRLTVKV